MLDIRELTVSFNGRTVLDRVSLSLAAGRTMAVVGESGAGKTTLGLAVAGLTTGRVEGRVFWGETGETDLLTLPPEEMRRRRWNEIALVFQSGGGSLHPGLPVEAQVVEPMVAHGRRRPSGARAHARQLLQAVGLPAEKHRAYPHTLSGGERQRAAIAMALANDPRLIILDEPTAGLDAITRRDILALLGNLSGRCALLILTHDLAAAAALAERAAVLYGGQVVEEGPAAVVLRAPRHPYTRGLLRSYPSMTTTKDLQGIPGRAHRIPDSGRGRPESHAGNNPAEHGREHHHHGHDRRLLHVHDNAHTHAHHDARRRRSNRREDPHRHGPHAASGAGAQSRGDGPDGFAGCPFHGRCTQGVAICRTVRPPVAATGDGHRLACHRGGIIPLLQVRNISKHYGPATALVGVSLVLHEGETVAVVGESGSGKTTLANVIMGLTAADAGEVFLEEQKIVRRDRDFYRRVQMVFQDPAASISHRQNVLQAVAEPLLLHLGGKPEAHAETVRRLLDEVQLPSDDHFLRKYPHHLSGGEAQRVAIARALTLNPKLLVADEPTSALDASVQAKVIRLLLRLQEERGLGLLLITHDLALARKVSDRIAVLHGGRIVEDGPSDRVTTSPEHPYTRALLAAARG
ncbi:MAG: ABC transporter ATP-binding protein [Bacillota bacterium]